MNCWLPNCGANDGALLFDLDVSDYRDLRPLLASHGCADVAGGRESAIWFSLPEVDGRYTVEAKQPSTSVTLRGPGSLLLSRVGINARRPGQANQLAIDLWIDGHNVVADPGSYRCTAPPPWGIALTVIETNATLRQVGETVAKVGRFLRMTMPDVQVASRRMLEGDVEVAVIERDAGHGCAGAWFAPGLLPRCQRGFGGRCQGAEEPRRSCRRSGPASAFGQCDHCGQCDHLDACR